MCDGQARSRQTYTDENGVERCSVCGDAVVSMVLGLKMPAVCSCRTRQLEEERAREAAAQLARKSRRNRELCFEDKCMLQYTFEADDSPHSELSRQLRAYADRFAEFRAEGSGLVLYGPVGTGKSWYAAAVANRLLDAGYSVHMVNMARLVLRLQAAEFREKEAMVNRLLRCDLLIIDDMGTEQQSKYMLDQMFLLVDGRCQARLPLLVTTNLDWNSITQPAAQEQARIHDRLLHRCMPLAVSGPSRRRSQAGENWKKMRSKLTQA